MRILIVEDQPELQEFLKSSLEADFFAVDAESDGEKACFLAKTNEYDLIILDNNLPNKTGAEICADIRKTKQNVPILILSVNAETKKKIDLLNTGADDYVTKPFSYEELVARIHALLRRQPMAPKEILKIEDLTVDPQKHKVKRGNTNIKLTRKEFMLLEYLLRNQGQVVSRGSILEHVWDIHGDIFSNTIETHILTLRKKIDTPHSPKLIHTISGRGYKISA